MSQLQNSTSGYEMMVARKAQLDRRAALLSTVLERVTDGIENGLENLRTPKGLMILGGIAAFGLVTGTMPFIAATIICGSVGTLFGVAIAGTQLQNMELSSGELGTAIAAADRARGILPSAAQPAPGQQNLGAFNTKAARPAENMKTVIAATLAAARGRKKEGPNA
jgi:hypothetical protein